MVFDACRNELRLTGAGQKALGAEKGFVPVAQTAGLLIAYATAPKQTASDVGEGGGPYARALAAEIVKPGIEAVTMFRNVQLKVKQSIGQDPWLSFPSLPEVYLAGRGAASAVTATGISPPPTITSPATPAQMSAAAEAWTLTKESTSTAALEAFIRRFGDTYYGDLAKSRLEELRNEQTRVALLQKQEEERKRAEVAAAAQRRVDEEVASRAKADAERERLAALPNPSTPSAPPASKATCGPDTLGVSRTVEIDTTGGPGFGRLRYTAHDFLLPREVILTFEDSLTPVTVKGVLETLREHCARATFFPSGLAATKVPQISKLIADAGHTVGFTTYYGMEFKALRADQHEEEIETGLSAVSAALGRPASPFFRAVGLNIPNETYSYLRKRDISIFAADIDGIGNAPKTRQQVLDAVFEELKKLGKGMVRLSSTNAAHAAALPQLLADLKAKGFRLVHMRARQPASQLQKYDAIVAQRGQKN